MYGRQYCVYMVVMSVLLFFCFKQKTADEMRISDWSSDVCSSDLLCAQAPGGGTYSLAQAGASATSISSSSAFSRCRSVRFMVCPYTRFDQGNAPPMRRSHWQHTRRLDRKSTRLNSSH